MLFAVLLTASVFWNIISIKPDFFMPPPSFWLWAADRQNILSVRQLTNSRKITEKF